MRSAGMVVAVASVVALAAGCGNGGGGRGGVWLTGASAGAGDDAGGGTGGNDGGTGGSSDGGGGAASLTAADDGHGQGEDGGGHHPVGTGGDTGTSGGGASDGTGEPPGDDCPPQCYCEPYFPDANVDDLVAGFSAGNWESTVFEFLDRRWPAGKVLLTDQENDPYFGTFSDKSSFDMAFGDGLPTEAHEMTHGWDFDHATVSEFSYFVRGDLELFPPKMDGFPRAEIFDLVQGESTAQYRDLYLTGTQGTYGWNDVLDEGNAYMDDLATYGVVPEFVPYAGISGRDGALAFMYYLELYLGVARAQHPSFYDQIKGTPDYVELVKTQWLRMHFFLQYVDEYPELGINDAEIRDLVYQADNQGEIEMFIDHALDASNCLP